VTRGTIRNNPVSAVVATFLLVEVMILAVRKAKTGFFPATSVAVLKTFLW
jgi:hypothetical protein